MSRQNASTLLFFRRFCCIVCRSRNQGRHISRSVARSRIDVSETPIIDLIHTSRRDQSKSLVSRIRSHQHAFIRIRSKVETHATAFGVTSFEETSIRKRLQAPADVGPFQMFCNGGSHAVIK